MATTALSVLNEAPKVGHVTGGEITMSTGDCNAGRYRLDDSLNAWSQNWVLDANMLLCASCTAGQCARDADQPFCHGDGCRLASDVTLYPWRELAELLRIVSQIP